MKIKKPIYKNVVQLKIFKGVVFQCYKDREVEHY